MDKTKSPRKSVGYSTPSIEYKVQKQQQNLKDIQASIAEADNNILATEELINRLKKYHEDEVKALIAKIEYLNTQHESLKNKNTELLNEKNKLEQEQKAGIKNTVVEKRPSLEKKPNFSDVKKNDTKPEEKKEIIADKIEPVGVPTKITKYSSEKKPITPTQEDKQQHNVRMKSQPKIQTIINNNNNKNSTPVKPDDTAARIRGDINAVGRSSSAGKVRQSINVPPPPTSISIADSAVAAINKVRTDSSEDWVILGYDDDLGGNNPALLRVKNSGKNGMEEMKKNLLDNQRSYCILKLVGGDEVSPTAKFVFISWLPTRTPVRRRWLNKEEVLKVVGNFAIDIQAAELEMLNVNKIKKQIF